MIAISVFIPLRSFLVDSAVCTLNFIIKMLKIYKSNSNKSNKSEPDYMLNLTLVISKECR